MSEIRNVKIASTSLGDADHGIMTTWLHLEWPGGGVGFGGYGFDEWDKTLDRRVDKTGTGLEWIKAILDVVGVERWEDLKGKNIRADLEGPGGRCLGIGNLLDDEKWFYPKAWFEQEGKRVGRDFK